eukprot:TRINITY_DN13821_c0_g1_i1.p1 TRINITY_DN13821_c0_g1~~TRINITY_DN13821_c0_g1_i1.p1  ORF type:complete len:106 (-),score=6.34 TRINITY_DN13821_c0_g1_i1:565-882(-)
MPLSSKWSSSTSSPHLHCPILEFITWRSLGLYFSGLFVVGIVLAEARLCCRRHSRWPDLHSPGTLHPLCLRQAISLSFQFSLRLFDIVSYMRRGLDDVHCVALLL